MNNRNLPLTQFHQFLYLYLIDSKYFG